MGYNVNNRAGCWILDTGYWIKVREFEHLFKLLECQLLFFV